MLRSSPRTRRAAAARAGAAAPGRLLDRLLVIGEALRPSTLRRVGRTWLSAALAGALISGLGIVLAMATDLMAPPTTQAASQQQAPPAEPPLPAFDRRLGAQPVHRLHTPAQTKVVALRRHYQLTSRQQALQETAVSTILQRREEALRSTVEETEQHQIEIWKERQRERIRKQVARDLAKRLAEAKAAIAAAEAEAEARRASGAEPPATADTAIADTRTAAAVSRSSMRSSLPAGGARLPVVSGVIGAPFGAYGSWSRYHTGVDFRAGYGEPVYAATSGVVTFAGNKGDWAGNHVAIRHAGGISSMSSHLSSIAVYPGQQVSAGQVIGRVGSTGRSFGAHLHFEAYPAGVTPGDVYSAVNPVPWLNSLGVSI